MVCEECKSCPIQDLCDEADRIVDERIGLDGEHDILLAIYEKGRRDVLEEFAHELKETLNQEFPKNYPSVKPYFTLDNARILVDAVAHQMYGSRRYDRGYGESDEGRI